MKILFLFFLLLSFSIIGFCQSPQAFNYQAIARKNDGSILAGQSVGVRFSILEGSASGVTIYQESYQTTTSNAGLFTLAIGKGNVLMGAFTSIKWGSGSKYLKVEIAPAGGNNFQLQGITQLLSVPYALYAENGGTPGPQGPQGVAGTTGPQGQQGQQGIQGPVGSIGPMGPIGLQGPQGQMGVAGPTGPVGPQGLIGPTGPQGQSGASGKTILNGTIDPTSQQGVDGDFYLNTKTSQMFGPKTGGVWGNGFSLKGSQGPAGPRSLIDLEYFSTNPSCAMGGVIVKSGVDVNYNNVLDAGEVDNTKTICFTQNSNPLDKQIVIPIAYSGSTSSTAGITGIGVIKFNKNNYPGVDSITLVGNPTIWNNGNASIVELYNMTDNTPINNSMITSTKMTSNPYIDPLLFIQSGNVYNSLPNHEITIGLSFRTTVAGMTAVSGQCFLYLYRK